MLARWTVAFSFATMAHLRKESDLERSLQARGGALARVQRVSSSLASMAHCARSPTLERSLQALYGCCSNQAKPQ